MASPKPTRIEVIGQLVEARDTIARLVTPPKMKSLIFDATLLTAAKIDSILSYDLACESWASTDTPAFKQDLKDTSTSDLREVHQRISRWNSKIQAHPKYVAAVEDYRRQEAHVVGEECRARLEQFLDKNVYHQLAIDPDQPLYHGVEVGSTADFEPLAKGKKSTKLSLFSPSDYAHILSNIVKTGLEAAPAPENLPGLETVFAVESPLQSYGLAGVGFSLGHQDKAWRQTHSSSEGIQIARHTFRRPFLVYVKSPEFLDCLDQEGVGSRSVLERLTPAKFIDYQAHLIAELEARNIDHVVINPDGTLDL